ncbi:uncharacterized protein AAG666_017556 [Megaptera novaeangliae]
MEALVGPVHSARGKSHAECGKDGNELKQEEDDTYLDPCLLSYIDELRSREDSVTKVEAVIHPRFLAELLSPDPQLDLLALAEELKQEEGLTPEELVQEPLLDLKEDEGGPAAPSHSAPGMGSSPSESHALQGAQRHDQDRHLGDGSSNTQREYSNFRRWQRFKPLARRHFHLSPDAEGFSCFLIPVLRSVARLNPNMPLEEGLRRAVQEWWRLSSLDRMIHYEMAEKFMEFAAEEEMHIQHLQCMQCAQDLPPPAPPKLDPRGPPAPKVHLQPGTQVPTGAEGTACAPRMSGPRAQPSHPKPHRSQRTQEPKAPKEIPPETEREPLLAKDAHSLFLLSEVEAVIHPRFLAELFSPDPQLDLLALAEELKQEEGLTPEELVQKPLLDLKEDEGGPAAPSHSAPGMGSSPSESHALQGAQRHDQDRHRGVSDEACPPEIDVEALHRPIRTVFRDFVPSRGRQAGKGGWTPGFPPQAPPPAAQLAPIVRPVNSGPWPHGTSREGRLATNQSNASQDGSSNPQKEYSNFRRWQLFKPLARRHFRLSPDAEAFSCFLIPVLRSVDRLKPTMMQEEGLRRAVQEWRRLSNLDRMIYYEMAEKFMEFAAEEEMHIQSLQWMQCAQDLPPPAPPKLDPRGPPAPKVHLQPGTQVPTGAEGTDPQLDLLALAEELKQEEGLTPEELVQKQLLDLKEDEGGPAAPSHSAPGMGSSPSESHALQGAQRHDQDRHRGVSDEACPPEIDVEALHRPIRTVFRDFVPSRGRQAGKGGWTPGFPPQAPPPAAQLAPIVRPVNSGPWPHGTSREGRLATNQSNASQDGSSNPQKEYSNFRRWQLFKPLARRHFRLSPDAEAFSCFLIPVLRSVDRLKPTMMQEEGLRRAVQEWRRLSNLDRMIYYEMAEKFMEFAAEEEMHIQSLQWMQCAQDLPPPAPPKLDPRGPPAPKVHLQPGTQVPTGAEGTELFSPDPQLDLLALAEELKQEEGLTPEELVQKQLLDLKEDEGGPAAPSHSAPGMGSSPSESHALQGAQRHDQDRHRGVSDEACPPEIDVEALHRPIRTVFRDFVPSRGRQAGKGGWTPGFPPQAPPPAAQLAPIVHPVNSGPWPHGTSREGRLATNQSNASQDGSSNPQKEYSNFRRWQLFKPLARRHFRLSPDAEAFSCFLIPVLRSVDRLKPTMMQEEGLRRAVQEWRRLSNLDRMIYYEMAEKFMEFAAEEEMHIQHLQCMQVKGALALYWDPRMRLFSERRLPFRRPEGRGQPVALLRLLLLPVATLELRGSPATATAAPGWAPGAGGAVEGSAPTPEAQRLAPGATGGGGVSTVCGKPKVMGKIYGGQDVVAGQWPWQASLQYQGSHVCGAVLINSHWVVSTAHCFLKKSPAPENYRALLGSTQLHQHTQHTREMPLSRIIAHPDFEKLHPFGSDVAMLQLLFPVNFTSYIIPACLPVPGMQLPSHSSCWITGWGMLNEETPLPEPFHLQEGKVGFIENKFCNIFYGLRKGKNFSVHEDMLCAGDFSTGKAICQAEDTIELDTQEPQHTAPPAPLSLSVTTACLRGSI